MDENVSTSTALMEVTQLPVITNQLSSVLPTIRERCSIIGSLVVNEENYKEMKKTRAELNKEHAEFRAMVKRIRDEVMAPLNEFLNGIVKEVDTAYSTGIGGLDESIKDTEGVLKSKRQEEVQQYFSEYRESLSLSPDLALFEKAGVKVGLSGSMKSLKEQARAYLDRIASDIQTIETLENRDEIMAEYRRNPDLNAAIQSVKDRLAREEAERNARIAAQEAARAREEHEAAVDAAVALAEQEASTRLLDASQHSGDDALLAPVPQAAEEEEPADDGQEPVCQATFRVRGTLAMLRELKAFLVEGGYKYETVKGGE